MRQHNKTVAIDFLIMHLKRFSTVDVCAAKSIADLNKYSKLQVQHFVTRNFRNICDLSLTMLRASCAWLNWAQSTVDTNLVLAVTCIFETCCLVNPG